MENGAMRKPYIEMWCNQEDWLGQKYIFSYKGLKLYLSVAAILNCDLCEQKNSYILKVFHLFAFSSHQLFLDIAFCNTVPHAGIHGGYYIFTLLIL
jgi:hypothetical protein